MKKKFVSIVLAALMVVTMTAGCGKSEQEASDTKTSKGSNSGIENQTGTDAADDAQNESETSKDTPKQVFTLDYNELDAWINYGFMGTSPSGEEVLLGINAGSDYGILIVTNDSDMTVFGYEGAYEYSYDDSVDYGYITIADEVFGYKELNDGELEIDMGDLGVTRVAIQTQPIVMIRIKEIIEKYTLVD
ncbi:MAG: hypothetical protein J1E01_05840 [Acetatifactor sp.]|nr:hypothetical protein [Acetatifactor sp.]